MQLHDIRCQFVAHSVRFFAESHAFQGLKSSLENEALGQRNMGVIMWVPPAVLQLVAWVETRFMPAWKHAPKDELLAMLLSKLGRTGTHAHTHTHLRPKLFGFKRYRRNREPRLQELNT